MKKIIAYSFLVMLLVLLVIASSPQLMRLISPIIPNRNINGDLYGLSDLAKFKQPVVDVPPVFTKTRIKNINLYLLCDSYTDFMDSDYFNTGNCKIISWNYPPWKIQPLDPQKKNILIIESTEKNVRERFQIPANDRVVIENGYNPLNDKNLQPALFKIKTETNLSLLLTYNNVVCFFKEIKAWLNLTVFNRVDDKVSLSQNKQFIFLKETTDSALVSSSFHVLSDSQLAVVAQNINASYHHFHSMGFTQVYLSIIPNEVSLMDTSEGNYNHLVERIETDQKLEIPTIDIYRVFKSSPSVYYYKSDIHWNKVGYTVWLQKVDSILYTVSLK